MTARVLVIDFNPAVYCELNNRQVKCIYGDVASLDTLQHAHVEAAKVVVSSLPDSILRGTTNERLLRAARRMCPQARIIVTADTIQAALELYAEGADFVFVPRIHSARYLAEIIRQALNRSVDAYREREIQDLAGRREVLA